MRNIFHTTKFQPNADPYYIEQMTKCIHSVHHHIVLKPQDVAEALYAAVDARDLRAWRMSTVHCYCSAKKLLSTSKWLCQVNVQMNCLGDIRGFEIRRSA